MKLKVKKKYTKNIRFDYFQLTFRNDGQLDREPDKIFNLKVWLNEAAKLKLEDRIEDYYDEQSRLERFLQDSGTKSLFLQFSRLRETNLSTRAKINESSHPITLEDDEYFGEEVAALYDETLSILMLQRNRNSLSPSGIQEYMNLLWKRVGTNKHITIFLRPIRWDNSIERAKKATVIKKLTVKFADLDKRGFTGKSAIKTILDGLREYNGNSGEITISLGRVNAKSLNQEEVSASITDLTKNENKGLFSAARITKKDNDDARVETVDLFDDRIHDYTQIGITEKRSFLIEDLMQPMIRLYETRRAEIASKIIKGGE